MPAKILGQLRGIITSAKEKSRNGRGYTEKFWDSIFDSEMFLEGIKNKMFFGELWHPEDDYDQIHPGDRSAVVLTKVEKEGLDYIGTFDILPTQAGKALKNLVDIGCIFGASSRGLSDYETDTFDDPSIYDLVTFDIVAFPGIKSARLHPVSTATTVSESYNFAKNKTKIMENLNSLSKTNEQLKQFIDSTLKTKEDFDNELQIEDYDKDFLETVYGIDDNDLINDAILIKTGDTGIPSYDDGVHGKHGIWTKYQDETFLEGLKPNEVYLVDDIFFNESLGGYEAIGKWLKIK